MGAVSFQVIFTLSKVFLLVVLISIIIAIHVGWITVKNLLQHFAYWIELSILVFIAIVAGAIIIAIQTVIYQANKAS